MFITSLATVALTAIVSVAATPSYERRALPIPDPAQVWVFMPTFRETMAYLFKTGQAWHWASESGDPDAPAIANFTATVVPGSIQPSGEDLLLKLSMAGKKCRYVNNFLDCTETTPTAPEAIIRGKVLTDVNGETFWNLLGGSPSWSVAHGGDLIWNVSKNDTAGLPANLYLRPVA
ncbi:hypothetical protein BKA62DRAFT_708861 [Auriculariales sp. MPI-PUGE-AT-0066]|nr:hypothetical protein BKA62DRAFT_708861 [Auriculariales sp. MPI-PUGE-AT-0066]